jgi:hypothetical protein
MNPVNVIVKLKAPIATSTNLSIPAIATLLTAEAAAAWGSARTRRFEPDSWAELAKSLAILPADAIYKELAAEFADHPRQAYKPTYVVVIRRDTPTAMVETVTVGGNTDGDYTHTIDGVDYTFAAVGKTQTEIRDGLVTAINAGTSPQTAAPVGGNQYTLTADEAGVSFVSEYASPGDVLTASVTTPNHGAAEDVAAAEAEDRTWYVLTETSRSDGVHKELSTYVNSVAARRLIYAPQSDTAAIKENVTTDVFSQLAALSHGRTFAVYHDADAQALASGWVGRCLPYPVGQVNWAHKQITGVTAIDFTAPALAGVTTNLEAKNVNRYDAVGLGSTLYATLLDGRFIDQLILKDTIELVLTERVLATLQTTDIVTFDDDGVAILAAAVKGYLKELADQGALAADSIAVTPIPIVDESANNKAKRNYSGLKWSAKARGAVNQLISINGIVEV